MSDLQNHKQVQLDNVAVIALLTSHRIPVDALRADDFDEILHQRQQSLLALVEKATGKQAQVSVAIAALDLAEPAESITAT